MPISRAAIPPLVLPEKLVEVPPLGGTALVRGMSLPQLMRYNAARRRLAVPEPGETDQEANERAGGGLVPLALHMCVLADDQQPIYTEGQWAHWCAMHPQIAVELVNEVLALSGQQPEQEKKP